MKKHRGVFLALCAMLCAAAAFAQSAESDFETKANIYGGVTITKYVGWDSKVVIPASIGGKAVIGIGESAFAKQDNLTSVTIPDSVMHIGKSAFATNKLASVTFGKGLVSIGEKAFYDNNLTSLTIPSSNTTIGEYAFARNKQLTSVTLGTYFAFDTKTSFIEEDDEPSARDWKTNNIGERGKNLFWDYVCNDRKAGTYTLDLKYRAPKKDGDFEYIETRTGAALVTYNGTSSALRLPEKVNGIAVKYLHTSMFRNTGEYDSSDKPVERVLIPNSVTSIGNGVFYEKSLTSVAIPDSVTIIGDEAFYGNQLTSVIIPDSVTYIGDSAFSHNALTSLTIGKNVFAIGDNAFSYNYPLTSVIIPDSVTFIGDEAFSMNALTSLTIGKSVFAIGEEAFSSAHLTSVVIPDSVMYIGDGAFKYSKLTSLTIGKSVFAIGKEAFSSANLTSVVIPDSVMYIGGAAFPRNVTSVTIGSSVTLESYMGDFAIPCAVAYDNNGQKAGVYRSIRGNWIYTKQ